MIYARVYLFAQILSFNRPYIKPTATPISLYIQRNRLSGEEDDNSKCTSHHRRVKTLTASQGFNKQCLPASPKDSRTKQIKNCTNFYFNLLSFCGCSARICAVLDYVRGWDESSSCHPTRKKPVPSGIQPSFHARSRWAAFCEGWRWCSCTVWALMYNWQREEKETSSAAST